MGHTFTNANNFLLLFATHYLPLGEFWHHLSTDIFERFWPLNHDWLILLKGQIIHGKPFGFDHDGNSSAILVPEFWSWSGSFYDPL